MPKIKLFADGADKSGILEMYKNPQIDGFTTNPTLMRKAGITDYVAFAKDLLREIPDKPISFEVFADEFDEMEHQALDIAGWGENVYVKIPVLNSKGKFMGPVIKELSSKKIKLNITAVYSFDQVEKVLVNLDKKTKSIISIFAGRMADKGKDPLPIFKKSILKVNKYKNIEILWASTREAYNFSQAKKLGCHIVTMPPKIINQINSFGKSSKQLTLETVKGFLIDSKKSKYKI